jgi:hypothetical protein
MVPLYDRGLVSGSGQRARERLSTLAGADNYGVVVLFRSH